MKACYFLPLMLLLTLFLNAQETALKVKQPAVFQSPNVKQSTPNYECISPNGFNLTVDTTGYDQYMLSISWDMVYQNDEWIHWDNGIHYSGIGSCPDMTAGSKWDGSQLKNYNGFLLKSMRVIINDMSADTVILKVWNGMNDNYLIYQDTILEYEDGEWLYHNFQNDMYLDSNSVLIIGYSTIGSFGNFPLGIDNSPSVVGYGNLIRTDNDFIWDTLTNYFLDGNWNIQFYAEDTKGNQKQLGRNSDERNITFVGYNLYHSLNGSDYELLDFIPFDIDSNYYSFSLDASTDLHCYKLTALWLYANDTCESAPATVLGNPDADSVCVLLVGEQVRESELLNGLRCYPNPFSTSVTIEYWVDKSETVSITFYNQFGKPVDRIENNQQKGLNTIVWNTENLPSGVYYYQLKAGNQLQQGKLLKTK